MTRRFTNSEVKTWKRCRRKWYFGQYRGLRQIKENPVSAAALGVIFHDALAAHYDPDDTRHPLEIVGFYEERDLLAAGENENLAKKVRAQSDLASAMVEGYLEWLQESGEDEDLEIVSVEAKVEVAVPSLGPDVSIMGKKDVRVRRRSTGFLSFMDHKSVDDFSRVGLLHLDEQMKWYLLLDVLEAAQAGEVAEELPTQGALYNMARKVKRTARSKPPYFQREEVRFNLPTIRSFWRTLHVEIGEILQAEERLASGVDHRDVCYPNPTRDCSWDCPFLSLCGAADEDPARAEAVIASYFETANPLARYDEGPSQTVIHSTSVPETEGE